MKTFLAVLAASLLAAAGTSGANAATNIQRVVSPKGIEAWLVEDQTVPLIAMSFAFTGGASQDPAGKPGIANMVSGLLDEGAGDLDSQAFQSALDDRSIELSFDASRDAFYGSVKTLTQNRDEAARLLKLALTKPRFDTEPVERVRAQVVAGIRQDERDPDDLASQALSEAAFPGHPYGRPVEGTLASVPTITATDLEGFVASNLARDNLKIAVVGAIDAKSLGAMLDDVFGELPAKASLAPVSEIAPGSAHEIDVNLDVPQTVIRLVGKGLKRDDPDFIPGTIATEILGGGGLTSRLYHEVREQRGLAYSVSLGLIPLDHAGLVTADTATKAASATEVVGLMEGVIKEFADEGPTQAELDQTKSYLIGSYPLRFNTSTKIADQLLNIQLDNLGIDYINRRNGLIAAVTIDDVRRVAKRLFDSGGFIIVRVGEKDT